MPNEIAPVLAELRQDHRNMARLLSLLELKTENVFEGGASELELMVDIMRYMTGYPDAVHHPKEDKLYAELRAARPDLAKGMSRVSDEHRLIGDQGIQLRDKLEAALSGNLVRRNDLVADSLRYIGSLRAHMRWEESDLFRRLDSMVKDGHEVIKVSTMVDHRDPLFGAKVEARFRTLYNAIGA